MNVCKNLNWKEMFLICVALFVVSTHAQTNIGQAAPGGSLRTCDRLRQDISLLFEQVYEKMPSLLNIMMDAAQDPTVGKRVDFGVDVMKRMIVSAFTSFLPICAQQHHRNEQDVLKANTPAWYFSNPRSQNPPSRFNSKSGSQKQIRDSIPTKLREKRSSSSSDGKIGSDAIVVGDAIIPLDIFQTGGSEDEEKPKVNIEFYV